MAEVQNYTEQSAKDIQSSSNFKDALSKALADSNITKEEALALIERIKWDKKEAISYTRNQAKILVDDLQVAWTETWINRDSFMKLLEKLSWEQSSNQASVQQPSELGAEKIEKVQPSLMDAVKTHMQNIGNIVTGKIDIAALPKQEQAIIQELQNTGFSLKPVEWKTGTYEVDMNWLFDKSTLTILPDWKMKFSTDGIKFAGKDVKYDFENLDKAKEMLTKINEYIKISFEIKPLEDIYETHRDFTQQDRYKELNSKKQKLEFDLWLKLDIK